MMPPAAAWAVRCGLPFGVRPGAARTTRSVSVGIVIAAVLCGRPNVISVVVSFSQKLVLAPASVVIAVADIGERDALAVVTLILPLAA